MTPREELRETFARLYEIMRREGNRDYIRTVEGALARLDDPALGDREAIAAIPTPGRWFEFFVWREDLESRRALNEPVDALVDRWTSISSLESGLRLEVTQDPEARATEARRAKDWFLQKLWFELPHHEADLSLLRVVDCDRDPTSAATLGTMMEIEQLLRQWANAGWESVALWFRIDPSNQPFVCREPRR